MVNAGLVLLLRVCVTVALVFASPASPARMRAAAGADITNTIHTLSAVRRAETVFLLSCTRDKCKQ